MDNIIELSKAQQLASENIEFAINVSRLHVNAKIKEAAREGKERVIIESGCLVSRVVKELQGAGYVIHPERSEDYRDMEQRWVIYWGYASDESNGIKLKEDDFTI